MPQRRRRKRRKTEVRLKGRHAAIAGVVFGVALIATTIGCVVWSDGGTSDGLRERDRPEPLEKLDRVEGWVPSWSDESIVAKQAIDAGFTDLLFFHGSVAEDGGVKLEDKTGLAAGVRAANEGGARAWLTVTNHGGDLSVALGKGVEDHANEVARVFHESGCDHLDLDYESLNYAEASGLIDLVNLLRDRIDSEAKIALTLQPVDEALRPEQRGVYERLLESEDVFTIRLMAYDYHWKNSLPGALYPMPAFERLIKHWQDYAHKLTICLPLYGYDWARPVDTTIPRGESVTIRDVRDLTAKPGFKAAWMREEGELAVTYHGHMVAVPSLRAIQMRVEFMLDWGVPGVSYWHLGCGRLEDVRNVSERDVEPTSAIPHGELASWDEWLVPYKRRVCKIVRGETSDTLETIGDRYGVSRSRMYRFNEHIAGGSCAGREVFVPAE